MYNLLVPIYIESKIRLGCNNDGGYIISQQHMNVKKLISCGCGNYTSFEEDFLIYNPNSLIDIYDINNICDLAIKDNRVTFYNKFINDMLDLNLDNECIIQMDIEGSEFDILKNYNGNFANIQQFIIEFHFDMIGDEDGWKNIFKKINKYFYLIHIHANNCVTSRRFDPVPSVIECTYLNKKLFNDYPYKDNRQYPITGLDQPNCINQSDIILDWWIQ